MSNSNVPVGVAEDWLAASALAQSDPSPTRGRAHTEPEDFAPPAFVPVDEDAEENRIVSSPMFTSDEQKDVYGCSICHSFSLNPLLTDCEHMYCGRCLREWIVARGKSTCPYCAVAIRGPGFNAYKNPLTSRLFSKLYDREVVKCPGLGCDWTGPVGDYRPHALDCRRKTEIESLRAQITANVSDINELNESFAIQVAVSAEKDLRIQELEEKLRRLANGDFSVTDRCLVDGDAGIVSSGVENEY